MLELAPVARLCRICENPAPNAPTRGPYANLCDDCRIEGVKKRSYSFAPKNNGIDLAMMVQKAIKPAKRFQKAVESRKAAKDEEQAALLELQSAMREIGAAAQRLVNHSENVKYRDGR